MVTLATRCHTVDRISTVFPLLKMTPCQTHWRASSNRLRKTRLKYQWFKDERLKQNVVWNLSSTRLILLYTKSQRPFPIKKHNSSVLRTHTTRNISNLVRPSRLFYSKTTTFRLIHWYYNCHWIQTHRGKQEVFGWSVGSKTFTSSVVKRSLTPI